YTAVRLSLPVPPKALADTSAWLAQPQRWDKNGGEGPFSDKKLARIQFGAALVEAFDARLGEDRKAPERAAEQGAGHQAKDGCWTVDAEGSVGSPATYGTALATYLARRTLVKADPKRYREEIARAERWLHGAPVKTLLDAAVALFTLEGETGEHAVQ